MRMIGTERQQSAGSVSELKIGRTTLVPVLVIVIRIPLAVCRPMRDTDRTRSGERVCPSEVREVENPRTRPGGRSRRRCSSRREGRTTVNPIYEFLVCHGAYASFEIVDRPQEEQGQVETMSEVSSRERERWSVIRDSCARARRSSNVQAASSIGILERVEREVERVARDQDGETRQKIAGDTRVRSRHVRRQKQ